MLIQFHVVRQHLVITGLPGQFLPGAHVTKRIHGDLFCGHYIAIVLSCMLVKQGPDSDHTHVVVLQANIVRQKSDRKVDIVECRLISYKLNRDGMETGCQYYLYNMLRHQ